MTKSVLVVGGGIGGLSAAIGLKRRGIDVQVLELAPTSKIYHVGIIVQGNFLAALDRLGIAEQAVAAGFPYDTLDNYHADGSFFYAQKPISLTKKFAPFLGITRPALHKVLLDEVAALGIPLRYGETFAAIEQDADGVTVTTTKGRTERVDLLVGADGVQSKVRDLVCVPNLKPNYTGQGVWRYNVPRLPEVTGLKVYMGKPDMGCGLVPLTQDTMYVFLVGREPDIRFPDETLADELRRRLDGYGGLIPQVREQVTDSSQVVYRPLMGLLVPPPWHRGRIVLLGDSAHATTPHMGQGAALAVEDAVVLAEEFDTQADLPTALANYNRRRFDRCRIVLESSRTIGEHEMNPNDGLDVKKLFHDVFEVLSQPL